MYGYIPLLRITFQYSDLGGNIKYRDDRLSIFKFCLLILHVIWSILAETPPRTTTSFLSFLPSHGRLEIDGGVRFGYNSAKKKKTAWSSLECLVDCTTVVFRITCQTFRIKFDKLGRASPIAKLPNPHRVFLGRPSVYTIIINSR